MGLYANVVIKKVEPVKTKESVSFQAIREIAVQKSLRQEVRQQKQTNNIKTSKYLEDLTNKGD